MLNSRGGPAELRGMRSWKAMSGAARHEVLKSDEVKCCVITSSVARYVVAQWWPSGAARHEVLESDQVKCCVTTSSVADTQWWPSSAACHEVLESY
eukprot:1146926-Pelagomonas_calceolata.AAC.3